MRQNSQCVMELDFGSCLFLLLLNLRNFSTWKKERNQYPNSLGGKVFSMRYSSTKKSQASCLKNIHKHLIRNKTVPQIRSRYKNQTKKILAEKGKSDVNLSGNGNINAILHYKENKVAPRLSEFYQRIPYEGKIVWRKVRDMPLTEVPPVWKKYLLNLRGENDPLDEDSDLHDNKFLHEKLTSGNCEQMILRILV